MSNHLQIHGKGSTFSTVTLRPWGVSSVSDPRLSSNPTHPIPSHPYLAVKKQGPSVEWKKQKWAEKAGKSETGGE